MLFFGERKPCYTFGLIGTKMGMSRVFGSDGESIPVTVINIGLNVVSSLRSL